jgi:hypothetical protein
LRRDPVEEVAELGGEPLQAVAVDDEEGADEEDGEAHFSHDLA